MSDPIIQLVLAPKVVGYLEKKMDDSDIALAEWLRKRAFEGSEEAPETDPSSPNDDRTITSDELYQAFLNVYFGRYHNTPFAQGRAREATDYVFLRVNQDQDLKDGKIDTEGEAGKFFENLTGQTAHLKAGGVILRWSKSRSQKVLREADKHWTRILPGDSSEKGGEKKTLPYVEITYYAPHYSCDAFMASARASYVADEQIGNVALTYQWPDPNQHDAFFRMIQISVATLNYATASRMVLKQDSSGCYSETHKLDDEFSRGRFQEEDAKRAYTVARRRKHQNQSDDDSFFQNRIIDVLEDVNYSSVYLAMGVQHVMVYKSMVDSDSPFMAEAAIEAAVAAVLYKVDDPRKGGDFDIPAWEYQGASDRPDKTESYESRSQ